MFIESAAFVFHPLYLKGRTPKSTECLRSENLSVKSFSYNSLKWNQKIKTQTRAGKSKFFYAFKIGWWTCKIHETDCSIHIIVIPCWSPLWETFIKIWYTSKAVITLESSDSKYKCWSITNPVKLFAIYFQKMDLSLQNHMLVLRAAIII